MESKTFRIFLIIFGLVSISLIIKSHISSKRKSTLTIQTEEPRKVFFTKNNTCNLRFVFSMQFNFPDSVTLLKQYTIIYQTENRVKNGYKQRE